MSRRRARAREPALGLGPPPVSPTLGVEERRRRVESVREALAELREIEAVLLDAQARIPSLTRRVRAVMETLDSATAPLVPRERVEVDDEHRED